jgi:hypothetical protein
MLLNVGDVDVLIVGAYVGDLLGAELTDGLTLGCSEGVRLPVVGEVLGDALTLGTADPCSSTKSLPVEFCPWPRSTMILLGSPPSMSETLT